jgi:signal transduction histidine kinase
MLRSLHLRLLSVIVGVSLLAVSLVALLSSRATVVEFNRYVTSGEGGSLERFRPELLAHYEQHKSWAEVAPVLERISNISGKQLILTDAHQSILAAAPAALHAAEIRITPEHSLFWTQQQQRGRELRVEQFTFANLQRVSLHNTAGELVGRLYLVPVPPRETRQNEESFLGSVNRSLLLAGVASAAVALIIALFLARRILRPVAALTTAVKRMQSGDLAQRVPVHSEDELGELARAFNAMADALARTEELRRNLVNDVAHELRTPLASIRCQLEALQDGLVEPNQAEINSLHEETMQLNRLVEDLQDLALAEAGQFSLDLQEVSVKQQAEQAIRSLHHLARERDVLIEVCLPENLPPVIADANRLRQILTNLIHNAVTHTPAGGRVTVEASSADSAIEMRIRDTGSGIAPEYLPHIFDRFYRTDHSRSRATGGSGLGLAIVKQLVELHGGSVWADSIIGQGSTVYFTLPISQELN